MSLEGPPSAIRVQCRLKFKRNTYAFLSHQSFQVSKARKMDGAGLFGKKEVEEEEEEVEEAPVRGTGLFGRRGTGKEVATAQETGSQKVKRGTTKEVGSQKKGSEKREGTTKGATKGLRGTLQLLFGGGESKPARELPRDENVVFVAGATGKVGSRVVRFASSPPPTAFHSY